MATYDVFVPASKVFCLALSAIAVLKLPNKSQVTDLLIIGSYLPLRSLNLHNVLSPMIISGHSQAHSLTLKLKQSYNFTLIPSSLKNLNKLLQCNSSTVPPYNATLENTIVSNWYPTGCHPSSSLLLLLNK